MVPIKTFSPWNLNILLISSLAVLLSKCITIFTKKTQGLAYRDFPRPLQAPLPFKNKLKFS